MLFLYDVILQCVTICGIHCLGVHLLQFSGRFETFVEIVTT